MVWLLLAACCIRRRATYVRETDSDWIGDEGCRRYVASKQASGDIGHGILEGKGKRKREREKEKVPSDGTYVGGIATMVARSRSRLENIYAVEVIRES